MLAARAGAESVVACDTHPSLVTAFRRVAANGFGSRVSVLKKDATLLERGKHTPYEGVNLITLDVFDAGLTGDQALFLLESVKRNVTASSCACRSARDDLLRGVESYTSEVDGFDMSSFNKYRWDSSYEATYMKDQSYRVLTKPKKVFEFFFDDSQKSKSRERCSKSKQSRTDT